MTLTQYIQSLKRQWYVVLLLTALVMAGVAAYTFTRVPTYEASSQMFVNVRNSESGDSAQLNQGSTFTQQRVKTYAQIITIPNLLNAVIKDLQLPYTVSELRNAIEVKTPVDTVLLDISVKDTNPTRAAAIANSITGQLPKFVNPVETPTGQSVSAVRLSTLQNAEVPTTPVSPRVPLNLAIGLLLGLAIGVTAAFLRDQLNTTIKSVADIESLTGAVPLGVMPFDKTTSSQPLADANDQTGRAEAYRSLRTNLQFTNVDNPPRVVVVTSSLPGEGKSTTACNLALTLALNGASTVLIGGDLRKPTLSEYLGISSAAGLTNVLAGQYGLEEVLVPFMQGKLAVLPSGPTPPNPSELLDSAQMRKIVTVLSDRFEYVVIDAPPVLPVTDGALLAAMADGALVVTRHGKTTRDNLQRTLQALTIVNAKVLGTVINFAPVNRGSGYEGYGYGYGGYAQQEAAAATANRHGHGAKVNPRIGAPEKNGQGPSTTTDGAVSPAAGKTPARAAGKDVGRAPGKRIATGAPTTAARPPVPGTSGAPPLAARPSALDDVISGRPGQPTPAPNGTSTPAATPASNGAAGATLNGTGDAAEVRSSTVLPRPSMPPPMTAPKDPADS